MDPDKTYDYDKMSEELELFLASFDINRAKDTLFYFILSYCKTLEDVPARFSSMIEDVDAVLELLLIIQNYEVGD